MNLFRYSTFARLFLALALLVGAGAEAQQNKNKKNRPKAQSSQAPSNQAQPANTKQVQQTLVKVDRKLLAYATSAARDELGALAKDESAQPLTALGRIYEQEKNYDEAARCLKKAGELDPADPAPYAHLGEAYLHQKRQGEADAAFREVEKRARAAVARSSNDAQAHYYLGLAQQRLRQFGTAAASFAKARQLDPGDPLPVYQLGVTRALEGKWQESVDELTAALGMNPNLAYAYYYRGQAASKLNRKDMLIADLERFLELAPEAPEAPIARRTIASAKR